MPNEFQIKPMPGKIAVEIIGNSEKIGELGIIIAPPSSDNPRTTGRVTAVFEDYYEDGNEFSPFVSVGDIVVFGRYTGTEMQVGRQKFVILKEVDLLCKLVADDETLRQVEADT